MHPLQNLPMYSTWLKLEDEPSPRLAWEIVDHYFSHYHDDLMHEYVWYMLTHALTSEVAELEAHDVDGLLFFYEYTKIFSRAMFISMSYGKSKSRNPQNSQL